MSATLIHHGHIRLIKQASQHGRVIIGLTSDDEIERTKGYRPELSFDARREILSAIADVDEVVATPWMITTEILDAHRIDLLVHGDDNVNPVPPDRVLVLPRTEGVSSMELRERALVSLFNGRNRRHMFTPGPTIVMPEAVDGLAPVFGRGDAEYQAIEQNVLNRLKIVAGQDQIVRLQGSATLALEIAIRTFVRGRVLVVQTGYYSNRLLEMATDAPHREATSGEGAGQVSAINYEDMDKVDGRFDWVIAVYTETSRATRVDLRRLRTRADAWHARLLLDATASIGLEPDHELADVVAFSSCKGLFGLTGACFIGYHDRVPEFSDNSFYMNLDVHRACKVTGPYHAICSLHRTLPVLEELRARVALSKERFIERFRPYVQVNRALQPLLCTHVTCALESTNVRAVLYQPRSDLPGSIVCHLGEAHVANASAVGSLYNALRIQT